MSRAAQHKPQSFGGLHTDITPVLSMDLAEIQGLSVASWRQESALHLPGLALSPNSFSGGWREVLGKRGHTEFSKSTQVSVPFGGGKKTLEETISAAGMWAGPFLLALAVRVIA